MLVFILFLALLLITLAFFLILSRQEKEKIELMHVVAHKFRSPISIIKWYIELVSDKSIGKLNDKQKEYFTEISNATERLNESIESLIILLQLQSNNLTLKMEEVNIKDLIAKIIQKLKLKIERHKINLQEIYPEKEELIAQTDLKLLNISLEHLVENAIMFTPEGGKIGIKANILGGKLLIEIKDNGCGIPKEKRAKVLVDSVSSKDMSLSLYLIKVILKKIRAHIYFESEENKGTTFFVSLPTNA
jgi:signal transduction histidine kinase